MNSCVTQVERLDIEGVDGLAALACKWVRASSSADGTFTVRAHDGSRRAGDLDTAWQAEGVNNLQGRTLDLQSAYKQLGRSRVDSAVCILAVWSPRTGSVELGESSVLPFGAVASVVHFNRVARA